MKLSRFKFLLRYGFGDAVLWVREHGDDGLEGAILEACRHDQRFDRQCEEDRGWYLAELLTATGRIDWYFERLSPWVLATRSLASQDQLLRLTKELGKRGYHPARQCVADYWQSLLRRRQNRYGYSTTCAEAYVELFGFKAYREVLDWIHRHIRVRPEPSWSFFVLHSIADQSRWKKSAAKLRSRWIQRDLAFARFVEFDECRPDHPEVEPQPEKDIGERILEGRSVRMDSVTSDQLDRALELFSRPLERHQARSLSMSLRRAKVAVPAERILPYLDMQPEEAKFQCIRALENTRDPRVRSLAMDCLHNNELRREGLCLFKTNFVPGDEKLLADLFVRRKVNNGFHWEVIAARELIERVPNADWGLLLLLLLDQQPCPLCRSGIVEELARRRLLSIEQWQALAFDTDSQTRQLARRRLRRHEMRHSATLHDAPA